MDAVRDGHQIHYEGPFVTTPRMDYHYYSANETCDVLSRFNTVILLGDSFFRHLTQSLLTMATGDPKQGALYYWKYNDTDPDFDRCIYDGQFETRGCHLSVQAETRLMPPEIRKNFCPGKDVDVTYIYFRKWSESDVFVRRFQQEIDKQKADPLRRPILLNVHHSIWDNYNETKVINDWLKPMSKVIAGYDSPKETKPQIIPVFHQPHFIPYNKPKHLAEKGQGYDDGLRFISALREVLYAPTKQAQNSSTPCEDSPTCGVNWFEFSTWNMSSMSRSFDGTHFGFGVNYLKATLLVNFMDIFTKSK